MANVKSKIKIWILLGIAFVILVATLTFMLSHDLSGSYQTNEFFPVTRITFFRDGKVTAQNMISSDLTEVYQGTYQKKWDGTYLIEFSDGTSNSQNPVLKAEASHTAEQCNLAVKKIDEQTMEIEVIPEGGLYAWLGKTAYFYWSGSDDNQSSDFLSDISKDNGLHETWDKYADPIDEPTSYYVETENAVKENIVPSSCAWNEIYANYLESSNITKGSVNFYLIYIDDDDIPEMYCDMADNADVDRMVYIRDGAAMEFQMWHMSEYGERSGLFSSNSTGHSGWWEDALYRLNQDGVSRLQYGEYMDAYDSDGMWAGFTYTWNGEEISEEEYSSRLENGTFGVFEPTPWPSVPVAIGVDDMSSYLKNLQ